MSTTKIYESYYAFLHRENKLENGVSKEFAEKHPDYEKQNETNEACWNCSDCSDCSDCSGLKNNAPDIMPEIPVLENIHQLVYQAASQPMALDMRDWHTCDTTHCRAGWAVHLAGEAGKKLEQHTTTLFAVTLHSLPSRHRSNLRNYQQATD